MTKIFEGGRTERLQAITRGMRLPLIAAPMFLVSGPDLVLAACRAGIAGAFPTPNARSIEILESWLRQVVEGHARACEAAPGEVGPWALNLVTHSSYDRLAPELDLVDRYQPPLVITALGSPAPAVERVHAYGGAVFADVSSLRFARRAAATGVDGLVLVSAGAGGHTGKVSPFAFVQAVREFYDGIIVLGGSIGHGGAVRAAELWRRPRRTLARRSSSQEKAWRRRWTRRWSARVVRRPGPRRARSRAPMPGTCARASWPPADPNALVAKDKMDWSNSEGQLKAWKDIWSAGQGVDHIHAVEPTAVIVDRYVAEYAEALRKPAFG